MLSRKWDLRNGRTLSVNRWKYGIIMTDIYTSSRERVHRELQCAVENDINIKKINILLFVQCFMVCPQCY